MAVKFTNNARSLLAGAITDSDLTLSVTASTGSRFPSLMTGEWFPLVVTDAEGNRIKGKERGAAKKRAMSARALADIDRWLGARELVATAQ